MLPTKEKGLFENYRQCELCGRRLSLSYQEEYCPACQNLKLFHDVRDYIRANNVNEYQVANHFQIPLKTIKEWIREGRIEYRKDNMVSTIDSMHCQNCGLPISFGTLCPKCLKLANNNMRGYEIKQHTSSGDRMRFLDHNNETNG